MTFLFTDIEGSTRRWEADADSMRASLLVHDEVLRTTIEGHDGFLFSHTGDGVVAAFSSPKAAVDAAVAAQLALELPVRMGIATGEAELRDGDYFGTVLNRAARVMAAGHGGQILVADSTAGLLSGVELDDLGPRRLRDLPTPIGLFQIRAPGLETEFPVLRTLDVSQGNLRPQTTSFVGRESEVAEIEAAVRAHRLVTLTGMGGVGKTRLALEVAGRLADEFPDGVWLFDLATVSDPAAVPDAVAAVLGITQQAGKSVSESVAAAQEGRIRLVVFDSCEHVLDAAADVVEAILAHSATVKVLATSREGLGLADEQMWPVPALDVDAGIGSSAVTLFADRARAVAPHFSVPDEADAVVEICGRLDGIPLAIELAGSRMASMTATEVRDRLDHRFRLLVGSRRESGKHQTLRHAVAWSFDLLSEAEKSLLVRCSVFAGGFDLESACAVAGSEDSDDYAVLDLLDALVRKSLLVADRTAGRTRFTMLETIRQFAEEQLAASGEADNVRALHSRCFANKETNILALWDSPRQREAYTWFNVELANLRTAHRWAIHHDDLDAAAGIATYAGLLGLMVQNFEPAAWAEELIEPALAADHARLGFICVIASQCWIVGRIEAALRYGEIAQTVRDKGGFEVPFGFDCFIGALYQTIGQPERWLDWSRAALGQRDDAYGLHRAALATALMVTGAIDEAMTASEEGLKAAETTHNPFALSNGLLGYGIAHASTDPIRSIAALRRGLAITQESGNRFNLSHTAATLARIESEHGDALAALDYLTLCIRNYHDSGSESLLRIPLGILATFLDRHARHEAAATIGGFAISPVTQAWITELDAAIAHLREVLGEQTYAALAADGEAMTISAMAAYAYDQIDSVRVELEHAQ